MSTNIESLLAYTNVMADPDVALISTDVAKHENEFVVIRHGIAKSIRIYLAASSLTASRKNWPPRAQVRARIQEGRRIAFENATTSHHGWNTTARRGTNSCTSAK